MHMIFDLQNTNSSITYAFSGQFSKTNNYLNGSYGVCHTDELIYLWEPLFDRDGDSVIGPLTGNDFAIRELLLQTWINFATYGDPTPPGSEFDWLPQMSNTKHNFWYISSLEPTMNSTQDIQDRWQLWNDLLGSKSSASGNSGLLLDSIIQFIITLLLQCFLLHIL